MGAASITCLAENSVSVVAYSLVPGRWGKDLQGFTIIDTRGQDVNAELVVENGLTHIGWEFLERLPRQPLVVRRSDRKIIPPWVVILECLGH